MGAGPTEVEDDEREGRLRYGNDSVASRGATRAQAMYRAVILRGRPIGLREVLL
jgi:hypothetical protein